MCEPFIWAVWFAIYMLSAKRPWTWLLFERKLLCCVNPVTRDSRAHNRYGGHDYRSNAHRAEEVWVGEQEEQRHVRHDLLEKLI